MKTTLLVAAMLFGIATVPAFAEGGEGGGGRLYVENRTPAQVAAIVHNAEVAAALQQPAPFDASLLPGARYTSSTPTANGQFVTLGSTGKTVG